MSKLDELAHVGGYARTSLLFRWLKDDASRSELYEELQDGQILRFQSRADARENEQDFAVFHQEVVLLASAQRIRAALTSNSFGNAPYRKLGSGTFMLGLDGGSHEAQRQSAVALLAPMTNESADLQAEQFGVLAALAWRAASIQPLKVRYFDLADLAEQVALRFTSFLFGFALSDHVLLEQTLRKAYRGLNYQIFGRHFVSEPLVLVEANAAMGVLLTRTAALLDTYGQADDVQQDELDRLDRELADIRQAAQAAGQPALEAFSPLLRRLARAEDSQSGAERAVVAVGLMVGMIGNIQAAVCSLVEDYFHKGDGDLGWRTFRDTKSSREEKVAHVMQVLRRRPPAAFLPRVALRDDPFDDNDPGFRKGTQIILAMGASGLESSKAATHSMDPVFGEGEGSQHSCIGIRLALSVVLYTTQQVLGLSALAQTIDAKTGALNPLRKLWGFKCESFPLQFDREAALIQHPLHVVMRVRTPVSVHAEALKLIIKYGAPRIESKLMESRHVHFAWFQFQENDAKLALMTVYDGEFDSYIEHFARRIGPMFDLLFEHIEDAPPLPTSKFPSEFVNTIRRYNLPPVADYFFSAYPPLTTDRILRSTGPAAGAAAA